ncbi:MAG TPA: D-alanyl-D-alanine carboxypeptidase [Actinomycetota bacterium]
MKPALTLLLSLMPAVVGAAPAGIPASAGLVVTPSMASYGEDLRAAGSLSAEADCLDGRVVRLERRPGDGSSWEEVTSGVTGGDGSFSFELAADANADYRAVVEARTDGATVCDEVTSDTAHSSVRAAVTTTARRRWPAGGCVRVEVAVTPPKPGQAVVVERREGAAWAEAGDGSLGPASRATVPVCSGWEDLGDLTLRARWAAQDDLNDAGTSRDLAVRVVRASWMRRVDRLAGGAVGISVREEGAFLFRHGDARRRAPASNQKLLLSMALLAALGPDARLATRVLARPPEDGVVPGDLWLVGGGDPEVGRAELRRLATRLRRAGVRRVEGSVRGSTRGLVRDWWARGWRPYFPRDYVARPTALVFEGNSARGRHVRDPEALAAEELTTQLRRAGIRVVRRSGSGRHPAGLEELARIQSRPIGDLLSTTNAYSSNFRAEVLGKVLGGTAADAPGSIARGARAIEAWAEDHGVRVTAFDSSGLSYANRATPEGIVRLLGAAEEAEWGEALRDGLPSAGHGTLDDRLEGVPVRAKTGTLTGISALSGWVLAKDRDAWVEFSIISTGLSTWRAKAIEDSVVRTLRRNL